VLLSLHCLLMVSCFSKKEDAQAFAERFGGKGCPRQGDDPEKQAGDPSALFRTNVRCKTSAHVGGRDQ
jgi:hypothetical protein